MIKYINESKLSHYQLAENILAAAERKVNNWVSIIFMMINVELHSIISYIRYKRSCI